MEKEGNIHDINVQLKDFFRSGSYSKPLLSENPHNILFLLDNVEYDSLSKEHIRQQAKTALAQNKKVQVSGHDNLLQNSEGIAKRIEVLVAQCSDITKKGTAIVPYKDFTVLKKAVELGMDINHRNDLLNFPIRQAILRSANEIANYLWESPHLNPTVLDGEGRNVAQIAFYKANFDRTKKIWNAYPELFYNKDFAGNTIYHDLRVWDKMLKSGSKRYEEKMQFLAAVHDFTYDYKVDVETLNNEGKNILMPETYRPVPPLAQYMKKQILHKKLSDSLPEKEMESKKLKI